MARTNAESCRIDATKLIGQQVEVVALGTVVPHKDKTVRYHVPLPEYGIALLVRAVDEDQARQILRDFISLFRESDMRPEDECHELYGRAIALLEPGPPR